MELPGQGATPDTERPGVELIFESVVPIRVAKLIADLRPVELPPVKEWKGLDAGAFTTLLSSLIIIAVVFATLISPQVDVMVQARDALCSGDRDFVCEWPSGGLSWQFLGRPNKPEAVLAQTPSTGSE